MRDGSTPGAPADVVAEWRARRYETIKAEIRVLDPEHRKGFVDLALRDLAEKRMLGASISRRAAQGDVLYGALGAVVVRVYALAVHGMDWDVPPAELLRGVGRA